jgi:hypothetical protein
MMSAWNGAPFLMTPSIFAFDASLASGAAPLTPSSM